MFFLIRKLFWYNIKVQIWWRFACTYFSSSWLLMLIFEAIVFFLWGLPKYCQAYCSNLKTLASSINISSKKSIKPIQLCKNTTSIMTYSVNKKLTIGEGVSKVFKSNLPTPTHLLCKSHPLEAFKRFNLTILYEIESNLDFRKSSKI